MQAVNQEKKFDMSGDRLQCQVLDTIGDDQTQFDYITGFDILVS